MGRFYPSSRPPNGLPPRSCVIYVKRALACFCPRQPSAFSRDPLSLPQPARHHMVEINKSSPERVRAASLKLKKDFFFFFQRGLNSSTGKKAALLPWAEADTRGDFIFIFRKRCLLIRGCYLKTTMDHEKKWSGGFWMAKRWMFDWQDGGQMVCLKETEQLWHINPLRWVGGGRCGGASLV